MEDKLRAYYLPLLKRYGATAPGVGWSSDETQRVRYRVLVEAMTAKRQHPGGAPRVLEVGCGAGGITTVPGVVMDGWAYRGIDVLPEMVAAAQCKAPKWLFEVADVRAGWCLADYVLASGIFALADWEEMRETIDAMWRACTTAVAFNFLSAGDGLGLETRCDPYAVLRECQNHTPWCTLRMDYHPRDATVYMYREARR